MYHLSTHRAVGAGFAIVASIALLTHPAPPEAAADDSFVPTVSIDGRYYQDSDDNRRHDEGLGLSIPLQGFTLATEAAFRSAHDNDGDPETEQVLVGLDATLPAAYRLQGRIGVVHFDDKVKPSGSLLFDHDARWGQFAARVEYTPLYETAEMIRNRVMFAGLEMAAKGAVHQRFHPGARLFLRDYSDNNDSVRVRGDLPIAAVLEPVRWELGYRQEFAAFRRQSRSGYFDPDDLHSFQFVTSIASQKYLELYAEFFGGYQRSKRYGSINSDGFYGFYLDATVRRVGPVEIALAAEGGDYSLGSAGGFRHVQAGLCIRNAK